ncbi:hypothetical protein [Actinopolyspora halophila]|uniref:hypothetical protein n=1 Tax=Actinopolyspora halophila TaxID=1850 RepID=UPI000370EB99|nr:hypothetical protein [Actinopolyspora halophila]
MSRNNSDPVEQAATAAQQMLEDKVDVVRRLAAAQQAEQPLRELATQAGQARKQSTDETVGAALEQAQGYLATAQHAAQEDTQGIRQEALEAGWTKGELSELGLASRPRSRSRSRKAGSSGGDGQVSAEHGADSVGASGAVGENDARG